MSTSPSWFDQEKFSRLVKKVGPKTVTEVLPSILGSEPETRPPEHLASTARISLVSKPSSLLSEQRALPTLPRRTGPLPNLKALFPAPTPPSPAPAREIPAETAKEESGEDSPAPTGTAPHEQDEGEMIEIWHKMSLLNEELARTVLERDQALHDIANLREQMRRNAEAGAPRADGPTAEEIDKLTKERDDALAQSQGLRLQVLQAKDASAGELAKVTKERDELRAEADKLRTELQQAKEASTGDSTNLAKERDDARAEAEKLRAELQQAKEASSGDAFKLTKDRDDARAETEKLRTELQQAKEASAGDASKLTKERDDARAETEKLRTELQQAKEASAGDLTKLTKERDDAYAELDKLRAEFMAANQSAKEKEDAGSGRVQEIASLTGERDQARRQYADLRMQFEKLKAEQSPREETIKFRKEWEQQLEERDKEIVTLKASAEVAAASAGDDKLKTELGSLREQMAKLKEEASVAQRGLALSQKALQQTRDALREATEGTSLSRHNFDNLKNECAILAQQNTVLQAQVDQLTRESGASKLKITTRVHQ